MLIQKMNYYYVLMKRSRSEMKKVLHKCKTFPYSLQYVKEQTDEICMVAVQQDGLVLQYVNVQTDEICMAAVQQNGWALAYVTNQTDEICMAAVQQNGQAL